MCHVVRDGRCYRLLWGLRQLTFARNGQPYEFDAGNSTVPAFSDLDATEGPILGAIDAPAAV